jgi:hypothetical protein
MNNPNPAFLVYCILVWGFHGSLLTTISIRVGASWTIPLLCCFMIDDGLALREAFSNYCTVSYFSREKDAELSSKIRQRGFCGINQHGGRKK